MERLDLLGKDELKKLYRRSALLYWAAAFFYPVAIFYAYIAKGLSEEFYNIMTCVYETKPTSLWIIAICGFAFMAIATLAIPYVMQHVRTKGGRIFLIFCDVLSIFHLFCALYGLIVQVDFWMVVYFAGTMISVWVFSQAFDKRLFGKNSFSHKQIAAAWEKRKNGEILPDEDLPRKKQNRWLSIICLIFAYLAMAMPWVFFAAILLIDSF
jgi:hypothetical protein